MGKRPRGESWLVIWCCLFLCVGVSIGLASGVRVGETRAKQRTKVVYLKSDNRTIIETPQVVIYADESLRVMDVPKELPLGAMKGK
jgi:hypothetical protein